MKSSVTVIAAATVLALGSGVGGAWAATVINGDNIKQNTVDTTEIQDGSLKGVDVMNGSLTGADVADASVTGTDVRDGSLTGSDVKDGSLSFAEVDPEFVSQFGAHMTPTNSGQIDRYGKRTLIWKNLPGVNWNSGQDMTIYVGGSASMEMDQLATLDVRSKYTVPVYISVTDATGRSVMCVAVPVAGFEESTCSSSRQLAGGPATVQGYWINEYGNHAYIDNTKVDVEFNSIQVQN